MPTNPVEMSERLLTDARKRPVKALAEAIWNSLDVGADHVDIAFEFTPLRLVAVGRVDRLRQLLNTELAGRTTGASRPNHGRCRGRTRAR